MADTTEDMAPDASPGELAPARHRGVRRVNNMPMYIVGGLVAIFLLIMALVAMDRASDDRGAADTEKSAGSTAMFAHAITGNRTEGFIEAFTPPAMPELPETAPPERTPPPRKPEPEPRQLRQLQPPPEPKPDPEAERIRQRKLQMLEAAIMAKTGVPLKLQEDRRAPATDGRAGANDPRAQLAALRQAMDGRTRNPMDVYKERLAQARASGLLGAGGAPSVASGQPSAGNSPGSYGQFAGSGGDRWRLDSRLQAPRTPFELRAGFVIPALLISGINSDLPGQIMAQVSQDVYDTPTGKYLLIPQGSRLVGTYSSQVAFGQSRVLIAWQRIVFPDGKALDIGAMPGADSAGYAGFKDKVNNHYFRLFGTAVLMSAVVAGVSLSQANYDSVNSNRQNARDALSEALGQQLGQAMAQLLMKNLNVSPTLEIRPGYRFNIIVTKDLTFGKPYEAFDY